MNLYMQESAIYLAGPMSGYPNYNYAAFHEAARRIRALYPKMRLFNPAETQLDGILDERKHYMAIDLRFIVNSAQGLVVLPNWQTSRGATTEVRVARELGLPVWTYEEVGESCVLTPLKDEPLVVAPLNVVNEAFADAYA